MNTMSLESLPLKQQSDKDFFRQFQIAHYTKRLSEAQSTEEKSFLRTTLHGLKKAEALTCVSIEGRLFRS